MTTILFSGGENENICAAFNRVLVALAISLVILTPLAWPSPAYAQSKEQLPQAYLNAVKEARKSDPDKIYKNLIAIAPYNQNLVWKKDAAGELLVKVVTWIPNSIEDTDPEFKVGAMSAPAGYNDATLIWVTAVPQIRSFCKQHYARRKESNLPLRILQVLGMPPMKVEASRFVEIWVQPKDLFRPAPDPEIDDHEAGIDFPVSGEFVSINQEYKDWFNKHRATVYTREIPGTWTRLGYTYDWGNPKNHVGMSEFIVRPGAMFEVAAIYTTDHYCR
jgi:hypothetical protein